MFVVIEIIVENLSRSYAQQRFNCLDSVDWKRLQIDSIPFWNQLAVFSWMTVELGLLGFVRLMTVQWLQQQPAGVHVVEIEFLCFASRYLPTWFENLHQTENFLTHSSVLVCIWQVFSTSHVKNNRFFQLIMLKTLLDFKRDKCTLQ